MDHVNVIKTFTYTDKTARLKTYTQKKRERERERERESRRNKKGEMSEVLYSFSTATSENRYGYI